jgi:NAD(P)H dehydrogenase (quinone)
VTAVLVYAHPDPGSYTAALRDAVQRGLASGGTPAEIVDLWADGFDPLDPGDAFSTGRHGALLREATTLVLVYPTWWSGQPAILTGWLAALPEHALQRVERLVAVTAHGSPRWVNVLEGETGRRIVKRTLRQRCARRATVEWIALYGIDRAGEAARVAFIRSVEQRLAHTRGARR